MSAPKISMPAINFQQVAEEFRTLDPKDPGQWPLIPRILILGGLFLLLLLGAWWLGWRGQLEELDGKQAEETRLKDEWLGKKKQAVNLDEYRRQLAEMDRSFGVLLKQLPNKSEMESLLVDVNQAGLGRGLQFELFKPGAEVMKGFYAELPITVKLIGSYHDLGAFAGDIAKMPRIVTLNDIEVMEAPGQKGSLMLSTTAKTFRYLDDEEIAKQKAAAKGAKK
ncbi:MAG TPA: type 4a pilus biogenesis protein PilO [Rhodocyclaceae bacterium]